MLDLFSHKRSSSHLLTYNKILDLIPQNKIFAFNNNKTTVMDNIKYGGKKILYSNPLGMADEWTTWIHRSHAG
jgi:hypothetical protein